MRRESALLADVLGACRKIEAIVSLTDEAAFLNDEVRTAAVLHHLTVIGEAVSRLPDNLKRRYPEVPWHEMAAVRNRIVHAYFDLDWQILWVAAIEDIPSLTRQVEQISAAEFPGDASASG